MINIAGYKEILAEANKHDATLVAVSKKQPNERIQAFYALGQRDFGENYVQELVPKHDVLPQDIRWHFIGHLQSNKVKEIATFVHLIHSVDRFSLLKEIDKQGAKIGRTIDVLIQIYVGSEDTKFGLDEKELLEVLEYYSAQKLNHVRICGFMGMASNTSDEEKIVKEFHQMKDVFEMMKTQFFFGKEHFNTLSIGMSGDYQLALANGSNMLRVGSSIFGARSY